MGWLRILETSVQSGPQEGWGSQVEMAAGLYPCWIPLSRCGREGEKPLSSKELHVSRASFFSQDNNRAMARAAIGVGRDSRVSAKFWVRETSQLVLVAQVLGMGIMLSLTKCCFCFFDFSAASASDRFNLCQHISRLETGPSPVLVSSLKMISFWSSFNGSHDSVLT